MEVSFLNGFYWKWRFQMFYFLFFFYFWWREHFYGRPCLLPPRILPRLTEISIPAHRAGLLGLGFYTGKSGYYVQFKKKYMYIHWRLWGQLHVLDAVHLYYRNVRFSLVKCSHLRLSVTTVACNLFDSVWKSQTKIHCLSFFTSVLALFAFLSPLACFPIQNQSTILSFFSCQLFWTGNSVNHFFCSLRFVVQMYLLVLLIYFLGVHMKLAILQILSFTFWFEIHLDWQHCNYL